MALPIAYRIRITEPIPAVRGSDVTMVDWIMAHDFALHTRSWTEITLSEIDQALRHHWSEALHASQNGRSKSLAIGDCFGTVSSRHTSP